MIRDKLKSKKLWAFAATLAGINTTLVTSGLSPEVAAICDLLALALYLWAESRTDVARANSGVCPVKPPEK